ncbi:hypothetical protein FIBSPDRAFT_866759 [Athelia psychrophila]|uniref:Uncharacterized protein n=1 Tax=Athelia psychrophila TaxID=1759441 RepID=A0A166EKS3_9AGAM|nr:hypothetical protein FIBSPDRAFT_866759 [Fibularhizoctonia sp. CBS 109695]
MAILFGNRAISPYGLLGIVTRNRFKKLIHEQYPFIQEDIDRGCMSAYISEVAIDAALMGSTTVKGPAKSSPSSHMGYEAGGEGAIGMGNLRVGSSVSHLRLPYDFEEFQGELGNHPPSARRGDMD